MHPLNSPMDLGFKTEAPAAAPAHEALQLRQALIKIYPDHWKPYAVLVRGDGYWLDGMLKDAAEGVGAVFRPKQDGRAPELLSIAIEAPDGLTFLVDPRAAKRCKTGAELFAARIHAPL